MKQRCAWCNGNKYIVVPVKVALYRNRISTAAKPCPACGGTGKSTSPSLFEPESSGQ